MSNANYIWTNHAKTRLNERRIPHEYINKALYYPDRTIHNSDGTIELQKRIEDKTVAAILRTNSKGEKIIVSCWVNPPFPGTKDAKQKSRYIQMQKASFWRKVWLTVLDQLGL
jgi:hypothetical protein